MGFWEYPDSDSDDDAAASAVFTGPVPGQVISRNVSSSREEPPNGANALSHRSPNKHNRLNHKALDGPDNFDVAAPEQPSHKHMVELLDDDDDEYAAKLPRKRRKSVLTKISLDQVEVPAAESKEAQRLKELQDQAMQAFLDDDDDDDEDEDEDDDEDEENIQTKSSSMRVRAPAALLEDIDDDDGDVEAELAREEEMLLKQGMPSASGADIMVLKVQCRHGHVQIRQGAHDSFVALMDKFRAYAVQQGWADKKSKMILECDGDRVDLENSSPEEFELEDGMALDVLIK